VKLEKKDNLASRVVGLLLLTYLGWSQIMERSENLQEHGFGPDPHGCYYRLCSAPGASPHLPSRYESLSNMNPVLKRAEPEFCLA
jgi:hypothetical protein